MCIHCIISVCTRSCFNASTRSCFSAGLIRHLVASTRSCISEYPYECNTSGWTRTDSSGARQGCPLPHSPGCPLPHSPGLSSPHSPGLRLPAFTRIEPPRLGSPLTLSLQGVTACAHHVWSSQVPGESTSTPASPLFITVGFNEGATAEAAKGEGVQEHVLDLDSKIGGEEPLDVIRAPKKDSAASRDRQPKFEL